MAASLLWGGPFEAAGLVVRGTRRQSPGVAAVEDPREDDVSVQDGPPAEVTQVTTGRQGDVLPPTEENSLL